MGAFDRFWKRDKLLKKTMVIENDLYEKLNELADDIYQTSTNQLINACIEEIIRTKDIKVYTKKAGVQHSLLIRKSLFEELEKMSDEYNLPIYKLVNISIKNAIEEEE